MQKMRRSVENAETVGLFPTPRYNPLGASTTNTFFRRCRTSGLSSMPVTRRRSGIAAITSPGVQRVLRGQPMTPSPRGSGLAALTSPGVQALLRGPDTPPMTPVGAHARAALPRAIPSGFTYHFGDRKTFAFHIISHLQNSYTDFRAY